MFLDDFATYTFTNTLATASLSDSLILNGNRTAVEEELKKEKLRSSKLDTRLSSLHLELENKVKELTSWRLKAEKAEKSLSEIPTRKSTILQVRFPFSLITDSSHIHLLSSLFSPLIQ